MPPKKSDSEWLEGQLRHLCEWGDRVSEVSPEVFHEYGLHTAFKLCALNYALGLFTPIARSNADKGWCDGSVFLDLFAGCGATKIGETGDWLPGSPIIATKAKKPFDKIVCAEIEPEFREALDKRLSRCGTPTPYEILDGDSNKIVGKIMEAIGLRNPLVFTFVDPEGMETYWDTIQTLAQNYKRMDFLINLTFGAERELGAVLSTGKSPKRIEDFSGVTLEEILVSHRGDVPEMYKARVQQVLGKKYGDSVLILDENNRPKYHLLIYARETGGGSPWRSGYMDIPRRIKTLNTEHVRGALNNIKGRGLARFRV